MKTLNSIGLIGLIMALLCACATTSLTKGDNRQKTNRIYKLSDFNVGDMRTASYLGNSLKNKLENILRQRGLLCTKDTKDACYIVDILIIADYPAFTPHQNLSSYTSITSKIVIKDLQNKIIREGIITTYNGFKEYTSDATEIHHAREIADFLAYE